MKKIVQCTPIMIVLFSLVIILPACTTIRNWALLGAVSKDKVVAVRLLLDEGIDIEAKNAVLLEAAYWGYTDIVETLLEHGADVNAKDDYGNTILSRAASRGNTHTVQALLEHSADVNAKNSNGITALMLAKKEGYTNIVELLKEAGAKG